MVGRWRLVVLGCVAALGLAGCTGGPPEAPPGPPARVSHPRAEVPKDRDAGAVLAAVRQLDLCAVQAAAMAATPGLPVLPAKAVAYAPFGCEAVQESSFSLTTTVEGFGTDARRAWPMRPLGGTKVYLRDGLDTCDAALPINFHDAVMIKLRWVGSPTSACTLVDALATSAAATLTDPVAGRGTPRWDACGVLRAALPDAKVTTEGISMDSCEAGSTTVAFNLIGVPTNASNPTSEQLDGVDVSILQVDDGCTVIWQAGPAPATATDRTGTFASVTEADCDRARTTAGKAMAALAKPLPTTPAPQQPLTYRADEPAAPLPGGCAWMLPLEGQHCEPYVEVPVPDKPAEAVRAAQADPNVHCAVALTAVAEHLGPDLVALTQSARDPNTPTECVFVGPDRRIQVAISLWPWKVADVPEISLVNPARVPGHAGYVKQTDDYYEMWLGLTGNAEDLGLVRLYLSDGAVGSNDFQDHVDAVRPLLTDILDQYLS